MKKQLILVELATETGLQVLPENLKKTFLKRMKEKKDAILELKKEEPSEHA